MLKSVSRRDLIRGLARLGFEGPYSGGRHMFMIKGSLKLRIPNPHQSDIGIALLKEILQQAGIHTSEWNKQ